ncbi:MAG: RHS repeat domain-containing protein [Pseudomonadota bacterium]
MQYGYDARGLPTSVAVGGTPLLADLRFSAGGMAGWTWGNGQVRAETRDLDGRLTRLTSGNALERTYGHDAADRLVAITDPAAGVNDVYAYDAVGRWCAKPALPSLGAIDCLRAGFRHPVKMGGFIACA